MDSYWSIHSQWMRQAADRMLVARDSDTSLELAAQRRIVHQ